MMRNFCLLVALIGLVLPWVAMADPYEQLPFNTFTPSTYLNSTGLTDDVQWDGYSLFVKGQRIYLYSGEIHSRSHPSSPQVTANITEQTSATSTRHSIPISCRGSRASASTEFPPISSGLSTANHRVCSIFRDGRRWDLSLRLRTMLDFG